MTYLNFEFIGGIYSKRKFLCLVLTVIMMISILPTGVLAADESATNSVVRLEDGIYIEVTVGETSVRATNTKNGYKKMCVEIVATKSSRRPN